ncbi:hypothetical protein [Pectobacterium phage Mimer]|nr:minor spike protein [Pectobacterium phage Mimer]
MFQSYVAEHVPPASFSQTLGAPVVAPISLNAALCRLSSAIYVADAQANITLNDQRLLAPAGNVTFSGLGVAFRLRPVVPESAQNSVFSTTGTVSISTISGSAAQDDFSAFRPMLLVWYGGTASAQQPIFGTGTWLLPIEYSASYDGTGVSRNLTLNWKDAISIGAPTTPADHRYAAIVLVGNISAGKQLAFSGAISARQVNDELSVFQPYK